MIDPIAISVIAIIVSIILAFFNYAYTNRKFKQTNYPFPFVSIIPESYKGHSEQTCLRLTIRNPHATSYMVNIEIFLSFENSFRGLRFWERREFLYAQKNCPDIPPKESKRIELDEKERIESFLVSKFSGRLFKEASLTPANLLAYHFIEERPIRFSVRIRYRPNMIDTNNASYVKHFSIGPTDGDLARLQRFIVIEEVT